LRCKYDWNPPQCKIASYESGVDRTYVSSIERAERNVSIDNVARIAEALAVEPWKPLKDG
jgi:transcriptional regulator with XRE-family HTH domain